MSNSLNVKLAVSLYEPALPELTHKNVIDCFVDFGIPIPIPQNQFCVDSGIPIPIPQNQLCVDSGIPNPILQNKIAELPFTRSQGEAKVIIPEGQGICPACGQIVYVLKNGTPKPTNHKC